MQAWSNRPSVAHSKLTQTVGVPFCADAWGVDASYSGSQKCLSAPPGAAPLFFGERAVAKLKARKVKPATYNLDLNLIGDYWGWWGKRRCN